MKRRFFVATAEATASLEAERGVLGSMLLLNATVPEVAEILKPRHFYLDRHQTIYSAILDAYRAGIEGIDVVTVGEQLSQRQQYEPCGGHGYLLELLQSVPHAKHARYYADIVLRKAHRRAVEQTLSESLHELQSNPDIEPSTLLARITQATSSLAARKASCRTITDVLSDYDPLNEIEPRRFLLGEGDFQKIDLRPGRILAFAAPPGRGKTAFACQCTFDAARFDSSLRALILNVEMEARVLLDRELSRMSGIDLQTIQNRRFSAEHRERIDYGLARIDEVADRIAFCGPPFTIDVLESAIRQHDPHIVVVDYLQRIIPKGEHGNKIDAIDSVVNSCREIAMEGRGVIAVSAVSRQRSSSGNATYSGLGLASLRGSSELEYGVDDAYLLEADGDSTADIIARHVKSRNGRREDLRFSFDGAHQAFTSTNDWTADIFPIKGAVG